MYQIPQSKRKPKAASEELFGRLSDDYQLCLACDQCISLPQGASVDGYVIRKDRDHQCHESKLLLQSITAKNKEKWNLIRPKPLSHDADTNRDLRVLDICDYAAMGASLCPMGNECPYPHNPVECKLWETAKIDLSLFIADVKSSSLVTRCFVERMRGAYDGKFELICGACFYGDTKSVASKRRHAAAFRCGHTGVDCKLLCFQTNDGQQCIPITADDSETHEVVLHCLKLKNKYSVSDEEILNESRRLDQKQSSPKNVATKTIKVHKFTIEDCDTPEWYPSRIKEREQHIEEFDIFDDYESVKKLVSSPNATSDYSELMVQDKSKISYYEAVPSLDELSEYIKGESKVYKRGLITLVDRDTAECRVIETNSDGQSEMIVKVLGRRNCGQCFTGDEVVVKILHPIEKDIEDSVGNQKADINAGQDLKILYRREQDVKESLEQQTIKIYLGKVVGVLKQNFNYKSHVFVCTRKESFIMIPLCDTSPAIRIFDFIIQKKYKNQKDSLVEVYSSGFELKKIVRLPRDTSQIMFLVKLLKWSSSNTLPLGYVVGILKAPETPEDEMKLLYIRYQIPWTQEKEEAGKSGQNYEYKENQKKHYPQLEKWEQQKQQLLISAGSSSAEDRRAITIDSIGTRCFDDAFTIRISNNLENVIIGVHITDVSEVVTKDDTDDIFASEMMEDWWYPSKKIRHLRPNRRIFQDEVRRACSLAADALEKSVLSMFFTVNRESGEISDEVEFRIMKIKILANLDYEVAQQIINNYYANILSDPPNEIESKVILAHEVVEKMRSRRLGRAKDFFEKDKDGEVDKYPDAQRLVEELSLTINLHVAMRLTQQDLNCIPLRRQLAPGEYAIRAWATGCDLSIIRESLYFAHPGWGLDEYRNGVRGDTRTLCCSRSTFEALLDDNVLAEHHMPVCDISRIRLRQRIIGTEFLHPQHRLTMLSWFRIQHKAEYVCSSVATTRAAKAHFHLHFPVYVQMTSPLRRFLDVVVHRLLKTSLGLQERAPYSSDQISELCVRSNDQRRKRAFKTDAKEIDFVESLSKYRLGVKCVILDFDDAELFLSLSTLKQGQSYGLSYHHLSVRTLPSINGHEADKKSVKLQWNMRLYNTKRAQNEGRPRNELHEMTNLSNNYVNFLDLRLNISEGLYTISEQGCGMNSDVVQQPSSNRDAEEGGCHATKVTSEMRKGEPFVIQHVKFSMTFTPGMIIMVQFGKYYISKSGRRELEVDLVTLAEDLDFCVLHKRNPVRCLSEIAFQRSMKTFYRSIEHYRDIWLPILSMESATTAVLGDQIVCRNVPTHIYSGSIVCNGVRHAHLTLDQSFCQQRKLTFILRKCNIGRGNYRADAIDDFICIRFTQPTSENTKETMNVSDASAESSQKTWIAHGSITSCAVERGKIELVCRLKHMNFLLKDDHQLFDKSSNCRCTVEFLLKSLPDRRREAAVRNETMSPLCTDILLNRNNLSNRSPLLAESVELENRLRGSNLNSEQKTAIKQAISHRFYLIHGPPGTGKTVAGVHLTESFVYRNRKKGTSAKRQVLYCGPSNSAVDVAACKLIEMSKSVNFVRVYSRSWERRIYPIPRDILEESSPIETKDELQEESNLIKSRSLHHMIRSQSNPKSGEICEFDVRFRANLQSPENVDDTEIEKYEKLVMEAEAIELKAAEVIFCTCISCGSVRIKMNTAIRQIIIDECGMSTEPDCLVPLTSFPDADQVVLIGDHLQLQPIVINHEAKRLGLGRSLFERHSDSVQLITMLKSQYRMHDSICRFPSTQFYDGKLLTVQPETDLRTQNVWPQNGERIVFCHLEGKEEKQKVATVEGSLYSISNEEQQKHAIRIMDRLWTQYHVARESIAILSQYKAQCSQLRRRLDSTDHSPSISTVVASQGKEWDYVIFSTVRSLSEYEIDPNPPRSWISENLGSVADPHQINVALTRAKHGLIILGNRNLLKVCPLWKAIIGFYERRRCIVDVEQFARSTANMR